jgi:hypothetical protein
MISLGRRVRSVSYSAHQRQTRPAPDVAADGRGLPHGDVLIRHVVTLEVIRRFRVDAEAMLASGEFEVVE